MPSPDQDSVLSRRRFLAAGAACAGAFAVPSLVGAPSAAAATGYTLTATNGSPGFLDVCLFQKAVVPGVPGAFSLAWLVAPAHAGATVTFTWSTDHSFVWAVTGPLTPGITFMPWGQIAADPNGPSRNRTGFGFDNGAYGFVPPTAGGTLPQGSLGIDVLATVPQDTASVGIGMSSAPVFAAQADPGANLVFRPDPQYWIAAGSYFRGEVLDVEEIEVAAEVPFGDAQSMRAFLSPSGGWSFSP